MILSLKFKTVKIRKSYTMNNCLHIKDGSEHFGEKKPNSAVGKPTAIQNTGKFSHACPERKVALARGGPTDRSTSVTR